MDKPVPKENGQKISYQEYDGFPEKLELISNDLLMSTTEKNHVLLVLLKNVGLKQFVNILPRESKKELYRLLQDGVKENKSTTSKK